MGFITLGVQKQTDKERIYEKSDLYHSCSHLHVNSF